MYQEKSNGLIAELIFAVLAIPLLLILKGVCTMFLWNNIINEIFDFSIELSVWKAIGINLFVGFVFFKKNGRKDEHKLDKSAYSIVIAEVISVLVVIATGGIVSLMI